MFRQLDGLQSISIDNDYSYLFTDKIIRNPFTNETVFLSIIGYNAVINNMARIINNTREKHNVYVRRYANSNLPKTKFKIMIKKKDSDFSHLIALAEDSYEFDERNGESFNSYVYCSSDSIKEKEDNIYKKITEYSSIPILREWMPYLINELEQICSLRELDTIGITNDIKIYKLDTNKFSLSHIVSTGLREKHISINNTNTKSYLLEECDNLNDYLAMFGESLANKIQNNFKPKFIPGQDKYTKYTNMIDDYVHHKTDIEFYEAQKTAIQAIVNNWKSSRNTLVCGEMGVGNFLLNFHIMY